MTRDLTTSKGEEKNAATKPAVRAVVKCSATPSVIHPRASSCALTYVDNQAGDMSE